jgi:uncharacterized membrane protein
VNNTRIEALSDGVFAIVMTLLIIEVKVPHHEGKHIANAELWARLIEILPLIRSYFVSFIVLGMFWIMHQAFFHHYVRRVNRYIGLLNILFLMFISLIPFSAHLLGQYQRNELPFVIYGSNIVILGSTMFVMLMLVIRDPEIRHEELSPRLIAQGTIRILIPTVCALIAIFTAQYSIGVSFFLFAFPIFFNVLPGTLDVPERALVKLQGYWQRKIHKGGNGS